MPENAYSLWLYTILVARIILINRPADNPRMGIARRDLDALLLTAKFSFFFFFVEAWFSLRVVRFRTNVSCYSIFRFSISISQPALENEETSSSWNYRWREWIDDDYDSFAAFSWNIHRAVIRMEKLGTVVTRGPVAHFPGISPRPTEGVARVIMQGGSPPTRSF